MKMEFKIVDVDDLVPNPFQPRKKPDAELDELSDSMKSRGDIQPVIVREHKKGYQIIAGERRWRAMKLAGIKKIPVLIRDTMEEDIRLESLIENLHREDLTSIERENAIYDEWKTGRWETRGELARALGKSERWVAENILAASIRKKERIPSTISTRTIIDTEGLATKEREQIIAKVGREEIPVERVREYARVVKRAPPPVKKAILRPKARITPRVAEKIMELPEKEQPETIREIETERLEEDEALTRIVVRKEELKAPPPVVVEKWAELKERYEKFQEELKAELETPEAKERGKLFRNWVAHTAISGSLGSIFCPICGANWKQFGWTCHHLNAKEALEKVEELYQESIKKGEKK